MEDAECCLGIVVIVRLPSLPSLPLLTSHLAHSAILTMFQIPDASSDPVTRTAALLSLICALMSLSYGCIYILRFGTMRNMYKASRWAEVCFPSPVNMRILFMEPLVCQEARKTNTVLFWNVWVLLAMPSVWLAWSMLLFIVTILSFVWRTGATNDPDPRSPLSTTGVLGPRIAVTGVFGLGMIYFVLIVKTLTSYGGPRNRDSLWRVGSASNNGGSVGGGGVARERERRGEDDTTRGRERERVRKGGMSHQEMEREEDESDRQGNDSERDGEDGKEKAPSGLRRVWGLGISGGDELTNQAVGAPGSSEKIVLEKPG